MDMPKKFYTAHTFSERHFVRDKICPFLHSLGIETVNPFYNPDKTVREGRKEVELADKTGESNWNELPQILTAVRKRTVVIVEQDLSDIDNCNGVVAYMQQISAGTVCEIFYTGHVCKKPVLLISGTNQIYEHPWLKEACSNNGKIFKSYPHFKKWMKKQYKKKAKKDGKES